jgi:hypothetical protein
MTFPTPSWASWRQAMAIAGCLLLTGWAGGLWCGLTWARRREPKAAVLTVGNGRASPSVDLSPKTAPRTVVTAALRPDVPPRPPVPVPTALGEQVRTSRVEIPATALPVVVELATFARMDGPRLRLQDVAWTSGPGAPVPLKVETVERDAPLPLPPAPRIPRWEADVILAPTQGRMGYGLGVSRAWGPITAGAMVIPQPGPGSTGYTGLLRFGFRW